MIISTVTRGRSGGKGGVDSPSPSPLFLSWVDLGTERVQELLLLCFSHSLQLCGVSGSEGVSSGSTQVPLSSICSLLFPSPHRCLLNAGSTRMNLLPTTTVLSGWCRHRGSPYSSSWVTPALCWREQLCREPDSLRGGGEWGGQGAKPGRWSLSVAATVPGQAWYPRHLFSTAPGCSRERAAVAPTLLGQQGIETVVSLGGRFLPPSRTHSMPSSPQSQSDPGAPDVLCHSSDHSSWSKGWCVASLFSKSWICPCNHLFAEVGGLIAGFISRILTQPHWDMGRVK